MQELIDSLLIALRSMWRYRWYAIGTTWITVVLGWAAISMIPNKYESRATVYVDTASILQPLLEGLTIDVDVSQKLGLMTKRLLSHANLEDVAKAADMDLAGASLEE